MRRRRTPLSIQHDAGKVLALRACRRWNQESAPGQACPGSGSAWSQNKSSPRSVLQPLYGWAARLPKERRRPAAQQPGRISHFWKLLLSAGISNSRRPGQQRPSLRQAEDCAPNSTGEAAALQPRFKASGCQSWAWNHGVPRTPEKFLLSPLLLLGTQEIVFICCRKLGLWLGLMRGANSPFSISAHNVQVWFPWQLWCCQQQWVPPAKRQP